jgi:hypothetical protein
MSCIRQNIDSAKVCLKTLQKMDIQYLLDCTERRTSLELILLPEHQRGNFR